MFSRLKTTLEQQVKGNFKANIFFNDVSQL